jgi:hypothetical protein
MGLVCNEEIVEVMTGMLRHKQHGRAVTRAPVTFRHITTAVDISNLHACSLFIIMNCTLLTCIEVQTKIDLGERCRSLEDPPLQGRPCSAGAAHDPKPSHARRGNSVVTLEKLSVIASPGPPACEIREQVQYTGTMVGRFWWARGMDSSAPSILIACWIVIDTHVGICAAIQLQKHARFDAT